MALPERIELEEISTLLPQLGSSILRGIAGEWPDRITTRRLQTEITTAVRAEAPDIARAYDIEVKVVPPGSVQVVLVARSAVDQLADLA
jgi:hypothetical protein